MKVGSKIVEKQGWTGLWRGNSSQMIRVMPYAATSYMTFPTYEKTLQQAVPPALVGMRPRTAVMEAYSAAGALLVARAMVATDATAITLAPLLLADQDEPLRADEQLLFIWREDGGYPHCVLSAPITMTPATSPPLQAAFANIGKHMGARKNCCCPITACPSGILLRAIRTTVSATKPPD